MPEYEEKIQKNIKHYEHVIRELPLKYTFEDIVKEIAEMTGIDTNTVAEKVWLEALNPGYNVTRDAIQFGLDFHIYNDKMKMFYKETNGFIFESIVEFFKIGKQTVLKHIKERINKYLLEHREGKIKILLLGDGAGSDTIYLFHFFHDKAEFYYFDVPESKTFNYAIKRFKKYNINTQLITKYENIPSNFFDVIICLETLEHLQNPEQAVKDIGKFLKLGGIALITESFGAVLPNFPTHLKSNLKYAGLTPFIFLKHNMYLTYYNKEALLLFRPMEFTKVRKTSILQKFELLKDFYILKNVLISLLKYLIREYHE